MLRVVWCGRSGLSGLPLLHQILLMISDASKAPDNFWARFPALGRESGTVELRKWHGLQILGTIVRMDQDQRGMIIQFVHLDDACH